MIQITADTRRAVVTNKELLTVGSAGIQVEFTLSEDWNALSKLAVFRVGDDGTKVDMALGESLTCVVPPEVLTQEDEVLFIGVYGANGQGTVIIPTVWASAGVVKPGTEPETPASATPTPEIWAQILSVANDAEQTAADAMSIVEDVVNHTPIIQDGYWYFWNEDAQEYQSTGIKAEGEDGTSPTITVVDIEGGHRVIITDVDHPQGQTIDVMNGTNGTDGNDGYSPVVTVTNITGGHRVTITDKTHPSGQSFDVMDGQDGASDAGEVTYDETATYPSGSVGAALTNQKNAIDQLDSEVAVIEKIAVSEVDTSGSVIHIENGIQGAPINLKKLTIEATQSGSGTPSPTNKRPFTGGYQSVNFYVSPTEDQEDATVQQFDLPAGAGTVYRGVIDFEAKTVTVKSVHKKLVGSGNEGISVYSGRRMRVSAPGFLGSGGNTLMSIYSDTLKTVTRAAQPANYAISQSDANKAELIMTLGANEATLDTVNAWLQENNVEIDYPLNTPVAYSFDEIPQLAMLNGDNYVWSDAGEIDLSYLAEKIVTDIETEQCAFFEDQSYTNVYNPNDPDILVDYEIQPSNDIRVYSGLMVSGYIPCSAGETFMFPVYTSHFGTGSTAYTISMYDASKSFLANVAGTMAYDILTITIPSDSAAKYFRVNVCKLNVNSSLIETQYHSASNFMVIKGTTFPDRFYPYEPQVLMDAEIYSSHENLSNPLYTKRVVFLGDSICEGDAKSGWAGRIGMDNTMLWCNRGIGGSTIAITSAGKTICTRSLLMSDPDYIIFEGGTNDADRIGDATGETKPAAFGTWSEDNYGTNDASTYYGFDINTFCGAVDYLCKRLISDYAGAKIGFIGAHKMGTTDSMRANRGYYIHTAMEICKKWGVPVLNLWDNCYLNPLIPAHYTSGQSYLYLDGQHLTANGYEYVTPIIEAWMKTL